MTKQPIAVDSTYLHNPNRPSGDVDLSWVVDAFEKAVKAGDPQVGIKALCDILEDEKLFPSVDTLARNIRSHRESNGDGEAATPPCPKCGSDKTALESAKGSTRRYVCRRCWKRFSKVGRPISRLRWNPWARPGCYTCVIAQSKL
jgi:hypothetical protein